MPRKQKIALHISDNENEQYLVRRTIKLVRPSLMIRHVGNANDAVEFLSQAKLFNDLPCLVIMDIELKINGHEAYQELRNDSLLNAIPIVVLFAADDDKESKKWRGNKILFIERPVKYREFAKSIRKALSYCL